MQASPADRQYAGPNATRRMCMHVLLLEVEKTAFGWIQLRCGETNHIVSIGY